MVRRILSLINKEVAGLHDAAYLLGFFSILSQLLALIRDRLFAHVFGAGIELDIYYASFRIPDIIFVSVASIVSISVLVPFVIDRMDNRKEIKQFINSIFSTFSLFIIVVCGVAYFLMPYLLKSSFPTLFANGQGESLIVLSRIMLISPILLGFSSLFASLIQASQKFFVYALSPLLYNLGIIAGVIFFYPSMGLNGLGLGVALGALLHLLVQMPSVYKDGLLPWPTIKINFASIKKVVALSLPRTFIISSNEVAKFFLIALAGVIGAGSISVFNFAWNLQSVPLSIIGVSYSLAIFPTLSKLFKSGQSEEFLLKMSASARHIIFLSLPALALCVVLRAQIVRSILGSGEFDWSDTRLTAAAFAIFVSSLLFQGLTLLFVRAFYSCGKTMKPFFIHLVSAAITVVIAYALNSGYFGGVAIKSWLEGLLRVKDIAGTPVLFLPLAFSIGSFINLFLHWVFFEREFKGFSSTVLRTLAHGVVSSVVAGFVAYVSLNLLDNVFDLDTFWGIFLQGLISGLVGIAASVGVLYLFKNDELAEIYTTLHHKIFKAKPIAADPDLG